MANQIIRASVLQCAVLLTPIIFHAGIPIQATAQPLPAEQPTVEKITDGLQIPWAFGFLPDGRVLVTELAGQVRTIDHTGRLLDENWLSVNFVEDGVEITGIAVSPDFAITRHIFVTVAINAGDNDRSHNADFEHRIYRFTDKSGFATDAKLIVEKIPAGDFHGGGRLAFGPDGKLYLSTGDAQSPSRSQDLQDLAGKILRFNDDGSIPADNPDPNLPVFATGLRNPHGFAWHPDTQDFFATEHGPTNRSGENGRRDEDELNIILPGANYGWPIVSGLKQDDRFTPPLIEWTPAIAPAGMMIVDFPGSSWDRSIFVAALRGQQLRHIVLTSKEQEGAKSNWSVSAQNVLFQRKYGRLRAVAQSLDGHLYFSSGNAVYRFNLMVASD